MQKVKKKKRVKWKNRLLVDIYELAKSGLKDTQIAQVLGVSYGMFAKWRETKPSLKYALKKGRGEGKRGVQMGESFAQYVYKRLSPDVQKVWDRIKKITDMAPKKGEYAYERIEEVLVEHGKEMRQMLLIHAIAERTFNMSEACRMVNVSLSTFDQWMEEPGFRRLVEEIRTHQKNFCEGALMRRVRKGDIAAVIFANKCLNKDRGYVEVTKSETTINHNLNVNLVNVSQLNLPLEVRKAVLQAHRDLIASQQPGRQNSLPAPQVMDVLSKPTEENDHEDQTAQTAPPTRTPRAVGKKAKALVGNKD